MKKDAKQWELNIIPLDGADVGGVEHDGVNEEEAFLVEEEALDAALVAEAHGGGRPDSVVHVAEGEVHADDQRGRLADGVAERDDVSRAARVQSGTDILFLKHASSIFRQSSNPLICGFSMMEQGRLCCLAHGELAWLFHEPHTGLNMLLSWFRKRMSGLEVRTVRPRISSAFLYHCSLRGWNPRGITDPG